MIHEVFPWQTITGSTHKAGRTMYPALHPSPHYCMITSGNLKKAHEDMFEATFNGSPIHYLVSEPRGWPNEVILEPNRILRDEHERESYVAEAIGASPDDVTDLTDADTDATYYAFIEQLEYSKFSHVSVPVGSGAFYLQAVRAVEDLELETRVVGFTPKKGNGVFIRDDAYEEQDGKLYYAGPWEDSIADKLTCPYTKHRKELHRTLERGHQIIQVSEEQLRCAYLFGNQMQEAIEPSSAAALIPFLPSGPNFKQVLACTTGSNAGAGFIDEPYTIETQGPLYLATAPRTQVFGIWSGDVAVKLEQRGHPKRPRVYFQNTRV